MPTIDGQPTIRDAVPSDEPGVRQCVRNAYQLYVARMNTPPAPMLADYRSLIGHGVVRVVELDGEIWGLIVMWPEPDHLYVDNIAVAPDHHGQGIGGLLLADAERAATQADRSEIRLYTNEAMTENLDYYPRRGFRETHRASESGYRRVYFSRRVPGPTVGGPTSG